MKTERTRGPSASAGEEAVAVVEEGGRGVGRGNVTVVIVVISGS